MSPRHAFYRSSRARQSEHSACLLHGTMSDAGEGDTPKKKGHGDRSGWLTLIGVGKLIKVAGLIAVGVVALRMHSRGVEAVLPDALHRWAGAVTALGQKKLAQIGVGAFAYAGLFSVEGVGLLRQKRWAEYFTLFITLSFVPLEIYEIARHPTLPKVATLVLNLAVAAYLGYHIRKRGRGQDEGRAGRPNRMMIPSHPRAR